MDETPERRCSRCATVKPLAAFGRDAHKASGHRYICRACDAAAARERKAKARAGLKPGGLVLAPTFPAPPAEPSPPVEAPKPEAPRSSHVAAVEEALARLSPPPGPVDAPLVAMLRDLARVMDGPMDLRDRATAQTRAIAALRELKATRASAPEAASTPGGKLAAFLAGTA